MTPRHHHVHTPPTRGDALGEACYAVWGIRALLCDAGLLGAGVDVELLAGPERAAVEAFVEFEGRLHLICPEPPDGEPF